MTTLPSSDIWSPWLSADLPADAMVVRRSSLRAPGCVGIYVSGPQYRGRPTQAFAWVGLPAAATEPVPGVVLVHGGGGSADADWVRQWTARGYAAIAVDTSGQLPVGEYGNWRRNPAGGPGGWGGFDQLDEPITEQWPFHAVAVVLAALSYLSALESVDAQRIGVIGISWGGLLSLLVAGVDSRPACVASVYGAGFLDRSPMFSAELAALAKGEQWLAQWDPRWYVPTASMPILFATGTNDTAWDLTSVTDTAALCAVPATLSIRLGLEHGHTQGVNSAECVAFVEQHLRGGAGLPTLSAPRLSASGVAQGIVSADVSTRADIATAWWYSTDQQGKWIDRRWHSHHAESVAQQGVCGHSVVTAAIAPGTTAGLLAVQDADNNCVTTSLVQFVKPD